MNIGFTPISQNYVQQPFDPATVDTEYQRGRFQQLRPVIQPTVNQRSWHVNVNYTRGEQIQSQLLTPHISVVPR